MSSKSQSRNVPPRTPTQRPKLTRASATAPSLATSHASRNDYSNYQTSYATTLLTRVAGYSQQKAGDVRSSPGSPGSSPDSSPEGPEGVERKDFALYHSGAYFSFPSFEDFPEYQARQQGTDGRPDSGVS